MASTRMQRVATLLQQSLSDLCTRRVKDPRVGLLSITEVEVTKDLMYAKVWVSVIGDRQQQVETVAGLRNAAGFLRRELGQEIKLRRIPELDFKLDESAERAMRLQELMDKLPQ